MISNQMLQKAVNELKALAGFELAVLDLDGNVEVTTFSGKDISSEAAAGFADSGEETKEIDGFSLFKIKDEAQTRYLLAVKGTSRNSEILGRMARYQLETLLLAYRERYDRDGFYKSLLTDNLLLVDIYSRSKKLYIEPAARRTVYVIETQPKEVDAVFAAIRNIFARDTEDAVIEMDTNTVVVIKRLDEKEEYDTLLQIAKRMNNALYADMGHELRISYGTIVKDLRDVSRSYKEANAAMEVGKIFFSGRMINAYTGLGIGRLIYQLPAPLCRLFMNEVFENVSLKDLDEETLETINKFLECSLNVSETSRQLFIHRNTLVYRLDKIKKNMGLDLRNFNDAVTFKIAMMVSQYMQHVEELEEKAGGKAL